MLSSKTRFKNEIEDFRKRVEKALPIAENLLRTKHRQKNGDWNRIMFPDAFEQLFRLYNWQIWCQRYRISLELLISIILEAFRHLRSVPKESKSNRFTLRLGLPLRTVTGPLARQKVEEEVARLFPNGENTRAQRKQPPPVQLEVNDPEDWDAVLNAYTKEMTNRHKNAVAETRRSRAGRWR